MTAKSDELNGVPRRRVGTLNFSVLTLNNAISLISSLGVRRPDQGIAVHFANAYNVALAGGDPDYRNLLNAGDLVFSDGTPIVWAGRRLHPEFSGVWCRIHGQWPSAQIVGVESPPFREPSATELTERDQRITESGATLVWVGLGTPKQDFEVHRLATNLPVVALAVGAAFDFLAGTVSQAPRWMQRSGLEWGYRLAQEPKRLAKRYIWGNPRFVAAVARQSLRRNASSQPE